MIASVHDDQCSHDGSILIYDLEQSNEPIDEPALLSQLVAWAAPIVARVATQPGQGVQSDRKAA
jgi:hypothetical protein